MAEAAQRLGRTPAEVRRLLAQGSLRGWRRGHHWVVDAADLARVSTHVRRPGRPMSPPRAWALLALLEDRDTAWVTSVARSQVRARMRDLEHADADHWRSLLRARASVVRCQAHPAAVRRLLVHADDVVASGPARAAALGIDLVAVDSDAEVYVHPDRWEELATRYVIGPARGAANLVVRVPPLWTFDGPAGEAVVATDLLDSAEPRAVEAGAAALRRLAARRAG